MNSGSNGGWSSLGMVASKTMIVALAGRPTNQETVTGPELRELRARRKAQRQARKKSR